MHRHRLGCAEERAEILRVLDVVEDEEQRRLAAILSENVVEFDVGIGVDFERNALGVGALLGELVEQPALDAAREF